MQHSRMQGGFSFWGGQQFSITIKKKIGGVLDCRPPPRHASPYKFIGGRLTSTSIEPTHRMPRIVKFKIGKEKKEKHFLWKQ